MDNSGTILDNLLDNLDRLYDRHCTPADTRDLLVASAAALGDVDWSQRLLGLAEAIDEYELPDGIAYGDAMTDSGWHVHALTVTGELRHLLASDWSDRHRSR